MIRYRQLIILVISACATSCISFAKEEPRLIVKLGTSLEDFQKDNRTKSCKLIEDKLKIGITYKCIGIERTKATSFLFYRRVLVQIISQFDEFDNIDTALIKLTLLTQPNNPTGESDYAKKIKPAIDEAEKVCKRTGPLLVEKPVEEIKQMPNGFPYQNFIRVHGDDSFRCLINIQKIKGPKGWFIIPEAVSLMNLPILIEYESKRKEESEKLIEKEKTKLSF